MSAALNISRRAGTSSMPIFRSSSVLNWCARAERDGAGAIAASAERVEAMNAVNKFGALGTYLANLRDENVRREYTYLTWELGAIVERG
jgi:hypothetical protein